MKQRATCLLCGRGLRQLTNGRYSHPKAEDCLVRFTDRYGIALTATTEPEKQNEEIEPDPLDIDLQVFPFVEDVLTEIFKSHGLERLGGKSTGKGWSSFAVWQRCQYLWHRNFHKPVQQIVRIEPEALAIGILVHTFLAIYYTRAIVPDYPLAPEHVFDALMLKANPKFVTEAWRVFAAYALYYQHDTIQPLAIEMDLKDPRTGESCRYDLIAFLPEALGELLPGTYVIEHKTAGRFDNATLDGWANDGEILGQIMLWERLGLENRFGKLRGVIVNLLGKQDEPKFERVIVPPQTWQIEQHKADLRSHDAMIQLANATGHYPRSRANCIGRYGKCSLYDHCRSGES